MSTEASETKKELKKLTPKEKQAKARQEKFLNELNRKATQVHTMLCNKFFDSFLLDPDPDGPHVQNQIKIVSAQWKVFCKRNNLTTDALERVEKYCLFIIEQYRNERDGKTEIPKEDGKPEQTKESPAVESEGASESNQTQGAASGDAVV